MPASVTLQVQNPDGTSRAFDLTEHDTFLLGLTREIATTIDQSLVRNPKDRFPDAGKLLAVISKARP